MSNPRSYNPVRIVPVPTAVLVPTTETSIPFNAATRQVYPMDLAAYGYVEEEYFVSGKAVLYGYSGTENDPLVVRAEDAPYTYRILVRKPADPARFSGSALVEIFNYANFMDNPGAGWGAMNEYLMACGDVWVGLTIRDCSVKALQTYDPERYAPLAMDNPIPPEQRGPFGEAYDFVIDRDMENGLSYDVLSQVAMLLRSGKDCSPLYGYDVHYVYATGASAGDLSAYAGYVHNLAQQPDGSPVYDGISIFMTGAPANLNQEEANILVPDPRSIIYPKVPTVRVLTLGDMHGRGYHPDWSLMQRRPDCDEPGMQYRIYEVSGATIGYRADKPVYPCKEDAERVGARWRDPRPQGEDYTFPAQYQIRMAFDGLKKWVEQGIPAPKAGRLETEGAFPEISFLFDEYGNVRGGVRSPYVEVPIATYAVSGITPFTPEQLKALYPSAADYVARVAASCVELCSQRLLLPADAMEIIAQAKRISDGWDW